MPVSKQTVATFQRAKAEGRKLAMLTAYDYSTAKLQDEAGVDGILIGDSLGNVILGYEDTLSVTMEDMIHHSRAVARGASHALIVCDMPFLSYEVSVEDAVRNAGRLLKEGRANAVKLEGGREVCPQVRAIVATGIPVMGHLGLTPQSARVRARRLGRTRHQPRLDSHHRHRSRRGMRRADSRLPGHARHDKRLLPQVRSALRRGGRRDAQGLLRLHRGSRCRHLPRRQRDLPLR